MNRNKRYPPEVRERAVRLVLVKWYPKTGQVVKL